MKIITDLRSRSPKKCKFSHYLFSLMLMERLVTFRSSQNISGASQHNSEAASEVDGELFLNRKKIVIKRRYLHPYESQDEGNAFGLIILIISL